MSYLPTIKLLDGTLREGETIELYVDFTGDLLSHLHPFKKWIVFNEKGVVYDNTEGQYVHPKDDDQVFEATNTDNIQVKGLKPGRLFAQFTYRTYLGEEKEVLQTFTVKPISSITVDSDIVSGDTGTFVATTLEDTDVTWTFEDDGSIIQGIIAEKVFTTTGYYDVDAIFDYSVSKHDDGSNVVWKSSPEDRLVGVNGPLGGGTQVLCVSAMAECVTETITGQYLVKYDVESAINLDLNFSNSIDNTTDAPLRSYVTDESTYNLELTGSDRIEFVQLDYGDNTSKKFQELNFKFAKIFKRSGTYNGTYYVHTAHDTDTGPTYRQVVSLDFTVEVSPFFTSWLKDHLNGELFNSKGFDDLAQAWGVQMDRLYNETQILLDSIDLERVDNKFLRGFAETYGDFPEIYEKVGFVNFSEGDSDRFKYLADYNFFDRIKTGDLSDTEKKEFINYIQQRRRDLQTKGTPESIERTISRFALTATIVELFADSYDPKEKVPLTDNVFGGDDIRNNTGIRGRALSTPLSDNIHTTMINSKENSYIEINTYDQNKIQYNTTDKPTKVINGTTYVEFDRE